MASRLKLSPVREGAKALQPLALVALVGIIGTATLLGGCGGGDTFSRTTPSPLVPVPITPSPGTTPTSTPTGGTTPTPTPTPGASGSTSPTPSPTPTPSNLTLTEALNVLRTNVNATISALTLGPDDRWAITYSVAGALPTDPVTYGYYLPIDAPAALRTALDGLVTAQARVRAIALGAGDTWVVTYNQASDSFTDYQTGTGVDAALLSQLVSLRLNQNVNVKSVLIGADPAAWALLLNQNGYRSQNLPAGLESALSGYAADGSVTLNHVALGADGTYAVVFNTNQIAGTATGLISFVNNTAGPIRTGNLAINGIGLGLGGSYAVAYNKNQSSAAGTTRSR